MQETKITLKIKLGEEIRRIGLKEKSLNGLQKQIEKIFGLNSGSYTLKYKDEEGDLVTISSEEELFESFQTIQNNLLKLEIITTPRDPYEKREEKCVELMKIDPNQQNNTDNNHSIPSHSNVPPHPHFHHDGHSHHKGKHESFNDFKGHSYPFHHKGYPHPPPFHGVHPHPPFHHGRHSPHHPPFHHHGGHQSHPFHPHSHPPFHHSGVPQPPFHHEQHPPFHHPNVHPHPPFHHGQHQPPIHFNPEFPFHHNKHHGEHVHPHPPFHHGRHAPHHPPFHHGSHSHPHQGKHHHRKHPHHSKNKKGERKQKKEEYFLAKLLKKGLCEIEQNFVCDGCEKKIRGDRFHCTECSDFDFCSSCFQSKISTHAQHRFETITALQALQHALRNGKQVYSFYEPKQPIVEEKEDEQQEEQGHAEPIQQEFNQFEEFPTNQQEPCQQSFQAEQRLIDDENFVTPHNNPSTPENNGEENNGVTVNPFQKRLDDLEMMGFNDRKKNIFALMQNKGEVQLAIEYLLQN